MSPDRWWRASSGARLEVTEQWRGDEWDSDGDLHLVRSRHPITGAMSTGTFGSAWSHRPWRRFLGATVLSHTGDFLYSVALVVYVIEETGSAGWIAAAVIGRMATYTVLGPVGGVIADRFDRRRLMVVLDASRAVSMTAIAIGIVVGVPPLVVLVLVIVCAALDDALPSGGGGGDSAAGGRGRPRRRQRHRGQPRPGGVVRRPGTRRSGRGHLRPRHWRSWSTAPRSPCRRCWWPGIGDVGGGARRRADTGDDDVRGEHHRASCSRVCTSCVTSAGCASLTWMLAAVMFAYGVEQVVQVLVVRDRLGLGRRGGGGAQRLRRSRRDPGDSVLGPAWRAERGPVSCSPCRDCLMGLPLALLAVTSQVWVAGGVDGGRRGREHHARRAVRHAVATGVRRGVCSAGSTRSRTAPARWRNWRGTIAAPLLVSACQSRARPVGRAAAHWSSPSLVLLPPLRATSLRTEAERRAAGPAGRRARARWASSARRRRPALERIARSAEATAVESGEVVFSEGDPSGRPLRGAGSGTVVGLDAKPTARSADSGPATGSARSGCCAGSVARRRSRRPRRPSCWRFRGPCSSTPSGPRSACPIRWRRRSRPASRAPILTWPKTRLTRAPDRLRQVSVDAQWGIVTMAVVEIPQATRWS